LAVLGDGIFTFQHLDDDRTGGHEGDQVLEEATLAVLGVETGGFALGQLPHLGGDDAQAGLFEAGGDFTDDVLGDGIRLDDGEGTLNGHGNHSRRRGWIKRKIEGARLYGGRESPAIRNDEATGPNGAAGRQERLWPMSART